MNIINDRSNRFRGLILGTAVGDSLGLPAEGLAPKTIQELGWQNWRHHMIFGKGLISDDTEHTLFVSQSLLCHSDNAKLFKSSLAWKLRWWLLSIPVGIGFGTLRAIIKLWLFVSLNKSGVKSAGNGPAMRSAIIGAFFCNAPDKIKEFVRSSTELTHTDPRALVGAAAVSYAARMGMLNPKEKRPETISFFESLRLLSSQEDKEWIKLIDMMEQALKDQLCVTDFAKKMNLYKGVTGYIYNTVPVAIYAWLRHYGDFKTTLTEALNCGGDTDTVGAITGALAGTTAGEDCIPGEWIHNIVEWPCSVYVLRKVADALAIYNSGQLSPVRYFWPGIITRNLLFFIIVLGHLFLRLVPIRLRCRMKI
jgi:ADP-ribosyl-[dinitrogen reductase] hydrolase